MGRRAIASRGSWGVAPLALLLGDASAAQDGTRRAPPRIDYRVECLLDGVQDHLAVDVKVRGLDPQKRDLAFELPNWGECLELDEYYVTRIAAKPPVRHDLVNRFYWRPELPASWEGALSLHYEIPIVALESFAHEHHGLLPWRMPTYAHAFTENTLMRLLLGSERQDADRHLELVAPKEFSIATGWGGVTSGPQRIDLLPDASNTVMLFGKPVAARASEEKKLGVSVVQFGVHEDRTQIVFDLATKVRAAYSATTGSPAPASELLVITEPGLGGTHVEGAITHGHPSVEADGRPDVGTDAFLAHEMFHAWLPGVLKPAKPLEDHGLEWFYEGFTEYFALWHLASAGLATPQQFADQVRLIERLGRQSPKWGRLAFADPKVHWRDPDAEPLAYKGGLLLALHLDVELRDHGEPGLPMLFRDLMKENGGRYDLSALRHWCEANGLEETWKRLVEQPATFTTDDQLVRAGYREKREGDKRTITATGADVAAFFKFEAAAR